MNFCHFPIDFIQLLIADDALMSKHFILNSTRSATFSVDISGEGFQNLKPTLPLPYGQRCLKITESVVHNDLHILSRYLINCLIYTTLIKN